MSLATAVREATCPVCSAKPWEFCKNLDGSTRSRMHAARRPRRGRKQHDVGTAWTDAIRDMIALVEKRYRNAPNAEASDALFDLLVILRNSLARGEVRS